MAKKNVPQSEKYPELTERQEFVYDYIREYVSEHPYPPTVREIQRHLKIKSTSTVQYALDALHNAGYITKSGNKMRAIEITEDARKNQVLPAPIVGNIAAGEPIFADQNISDYCALPSNIFSSNKNLFVLNVKGTSMIEAGIYDGDYVIVEQRDYAENGEIIAALIDDSATVKRYYNDGDVIRLQPENKEMEPILIKGDILILGKVVGLLRSNIH